MARIPTVRLRRKRDGKEMIVNQVDYASDIAAWSDWKLVGDSHDGASRVTIQTEVPEPGPETETAPAGSDETADANATPDYLAMKWPELRKTVGALVRAEDAKARLPRNKAEAHAELQKRGLIASED